MLILRCLPFTLAGMVYALYVTGLPTGATVLIGMLGLASVNQGVLLLTYAEEMRKESRTFALIVVPEAAKIRLQLTRMVAFMASVGFIPLAHILEEGGDLLQPMAAATVGGLWVGIFVALFLMPCLYVIFSRKGRRPSD